LPAGAAAEIEETSLNPLDNADSLWFSYREVRTSSESDSGFTAGRAIGSVRSFVGSGADQPLLVDSLGRGVASTSEQASVRTPAERASQSDSFASASATTGATA
jgi:hypothetical protein